MSKIFLTFSPFPGKHKQELPHLISFNFFEYISAVKCSTTIHAMPVPRKHLKNIHSIQYLDIMSSSIFIKAHQVDFLSLDQRLAKHELLKVL